jgi:hypothetical protein
MHRVTRHARWLAGSAIALSAVMLVASCAAGEKPEAAGNTTSAAPPTTAGTPAHGVHGAAYSAPPAAPLRAGERFVTLKLPEPYQPKAPTSGGIDEYRCFLLDAGVTSAGYLTGSQFLPQNTAIVHHAIVYRIGAEQAVQARALDANTDGQGWTCFGDAGIEGGDWVGHWAPGADESLLTQKVGYPMPADSRLVLQVHYNLLATEGKPGGTDQSSLRLRLADGSTPLAPLNTGLLFAPIELACTPQESGPLCDRTAAVDDVAKRFGEDSRQQVVELNQFCDKGKAPVASVTRHCDTPVPADTTVYAVAGHMHLLGRSIKIELNPGTAKSKTLLDIPDYNFDAQSVRPLASPVKVKQGDTLRVTCTHDAGLRAKLPALQNLPARYVVWGEGTSDEMCLGLLINSPSGGQPQ